MPRPRSDLTGQVYGHLVAIRDMNKSNHNRTRIWQFYCKACQSYTEKPSTKVKNGEIKSCGCQTHVRSLRTPKGHSGARSSYVGYMGSAKRRGLPFALTFEEYKEIVVKPCYYCGVSSSKICYGSLNNARNHGEFICNGIDREDNTKGYTKENSVACCTSCNIGKGTSSTQEFLDWIQQVYKHNFTNQ